MFIIVIETLDMSPGHVGESIGEPTRIEFESGRAALREMDKIIEDETIGGDNRRILLELPTGERRPFNQAFHAITGEHPRYGRQARLINRKELES